MGKRKIEKNLKLFVKRVKKQFKPEQVLLFGSYARGQANKYSDVDVVVVADVFRMFPFEKRLDVLYPLIYDLSPDFHPLGYTPEEFQKVNKLTTLSEIKKYAVSLL